MATYTPNFNLYMPDSTDPLEDFRSEFNTNMQTIDSNLGGGGGGGGNVYGAFIDTNRVITSGSYSLSLSYTATEDCFLYTAVALNSNTSGSCAVDGETVSSWWNGSGGTVAEGIGIYLKLGQTFTATATNSSSSGYTVYGLTQGTESIFTPIIYSDNERVIGIWRDNKPLYQRTYDLGSEVSVSNSTWQSTGIDVSNVEMIPKCGALAADGTYQSDLLAWNNGGDLYIQTPRNSTGYARYLILQYTKTTDSAGSGNWNTDGVPTVHYSTSEQVIGTWIDGKPIYQRVITGLSIGQNTGASYTIPKPSPDLKQIIDSTLMSTLTQYKTVTHPPTWITDSSNLAIRSQEADTYDTFIIAYTKTTD